ncbi:alginate O-acetyltransferase AlgX-related protein [Oceaniglobus roseus]|uniref:alginate O-acetyltransferase AlgX-related protein n=1 Tax=Oceaniglobus roseus TaxID=1737570 RepID=UPI000C7F4A42|nr:hypothetical protein [Kandeliimicrobium roseum]
MKRLSGFLLAAAISLAGAMGAEAQSAFGCSGLATRQGMQAVEGREGVFFRVDPDLKMFHPFSDGSIELVAELSDALAERGTQLIYLPVPTKSLAMPGYLPPEAWDFGFDPDLATTLYADIVKRLEAKGVATADVRRAMVSARGGPLPYHRADYRWTAEGGRLAADAVAERLGAAPAAASLRKSNFASTPGGVTEIDSKMRAQLQRDCVLSLPKVETAAYTTSRAQGFAVQPQGTIFGPGATLGVARIAVVGTAYTGEPSVNFAGFLSEYTGLEVMQYAVPEGGAFAAISSYLTSDAFRSARPSVLVWEVPVEANLAAFGDQPLRELIAAAGDTCRVPLNLFSTGQANQIRVDLNALDPMLDYTLALDTGGSDSAEARFTFRSRNGMMRSRSVVRDPDQIRTGRFYMPMSGLWDSGAQSVDIELAAGFGAAPQVTACFYSGKG